MKAATIFYHKNIDKIYFEQWVTDCIDSVKNQTFKDFDIFELNYGEDNKILTDGFFYKTTLRNHIEAMNLMIDYIFGLGYDVIFNNNLDDISNPERFEKQLVKIKQGYQLVSSNFRYFGEAEKDMDMVVKGDIGRNLLKGHNVIAHSCVAMHRTFWDDDLHYNENLLGYEDLDLWQRAWRKGKRFFILPDYLLNYRIHSHQVTQMYSSDGSKKK